MALKLTKKTLTLAAKNLQEGLNLLDEEDEPLELITKDMVLSDMKDKIKEAGKLIELEDLSELTEDTLAVLAVLKVKLPEPEVVEEEEWTWDEISKMSRKKLIELCENNDLVTDAEDYDSLEDYRKDVGIEIGLISDEKTDDTDDEDETGSDDEINADDAVDDADDADDDVDDEKLEEREAKKPKEKKASPKTATTKKMTRIESVLQAIKKEKTQSMESIIPASDLIYSQAGGASNMSEAKWASKTVLSIIDSIKELEIKIS